MSLTSMMTFGMMPSDDDVAELTGLGEWEQEWDQRVQAMETKKQARKQRGMGAAISEQALQPGFKMMERPLEAQMYAQTRGEQQSGDEQERVAVEHVDSKGRKSVEYVSKEDSDQANGTFDSVKAEPTGADRAAAYAAALRPKFSDNSSDKDSVDKQMDI